MRSLDVHEERRNSALLTAGMLDKENRQVLDKLVEAKYCFSEIHGQTRLALPMGGAQPELRR